MTIMPLFNALHTSSYYFELCNLVFFCFRWLPEFLKELLPENRWHGYANHIVHMLCESRGFKVELEDTITLNEGVVSARSKADYVCYALRRLLPVVILETKYLHNITNDAIDQLLGYYCKNLTAEPTNLQGSAILFNLSKQSKSIEIKLYAFSLLLDRYPGFNVSKAPL